MQSESSSTAYKNWSIDKGDYVRKGLSNDGKYSKAKISLGVKILIVSLSIITAVSGIILYLKNTSHF